VRFVRLAAFVVSMVLIAATMLSLVARRAELYAEQEATVATVTVGAADVIDATLQGARAAVETATADTDPEALAALFDGADACVAAAGGKRLCTGPDLVEIAASARVGKTGGAGTSIAFADETLGSVLVVAEGGTTVALQFPAGELLAGSGLAGLADLVVEVSDDDAATTFDEPEDGNGELTAVVDVGDPLDAGTVKVTASVESGVALLADAPARYGTWLALGTVLLAVVAWTLFAERRSLERRATTDELTGLLNRREFERQADEALLVASRLDTGLCVMLIDLNGFKEINDTYGHQQGDVALRGCADRLVAAVRDTDVVGRWGGDEFVILLPGLDERTAVRNRAERIAEALSELPVVGEIRVSGSIGAAMYPRHGRDFDELVRAADVAMYGAKTTGVPFRIADVLADELAEGLDESSGDWDEEPEPHDAPHRLGG
jgi:diguanylate cyclase (GGDEF)-like protein